MESVIVIDTTGGRVCLECSLYLFSTDTGCTVELVLSSSVKYREIFNRRGNTAEGCVSGVTAGEYVVRVYDQSSSELVHEVDNATYHNHNLFLLLASEPQSLVQLVKKAKINY